ncbi:MAG: response regulator transcription factor [Gemmatimonadaceae bacterium]|nr:response regulator transcription factor [Gemmatimonadaceae bacterium]
MRILLAEDDTHLLASITRGLREASYDVVQATTGTSALEAARGGSYDVVVLDVLLPGMTGLAVCEAIRSHGDRVPILMLTALDAVEHRIAGLDAGADDYLTKPFDFGELLARLRALTRRHLDRPPARLTVGDLVIDTERHAVQRGDREIALTAREFALLSYLATHAGRVVSRAELMEHVWDDHPDKYSNIIDVYASRLRRKVDEGEAVALFSTIRGIGFLLEPPPASSTRSRKRP